VSREGQEQQNADARGRLGDEDRPDDSPPLGEVPADELSRGPACKGHPNASPIRSILAPLPSRRNGRKVRRRFATRCRWRGSWKAAEATRVPDSPPVASGVGGEVA